MAVTFTRKDTETKAEITVATTKDGNISSYLNQVISDLENGRAPLDKRYVPDFLESAKALKKQFGAK